jgi:hypothetical protein
MRRSNLLKALAVVVLGATALAGAPANANAGAFECGFAECIVTDTCPDMPTFCALHNCITEFYNCGELFACSGNKRLHWCGQSPDQ